MKFLKSRTHKVCLVLLVLILLLCCVSNTYAAINGSASAAGEAVKDLLSIVINTVGMGVLGTAVVPLINFCSVIIFVVLYVLFVGMDATSGLAFPFPDQIVFNKIPLLDPNFINPDSNAIFGSTALQQILKNMYSSFFVLATTIFTIAALIIGIKLVFSSLAAEKAKYKQALNTWIVGIVMLFMVHYLLAGMFYLNEQIVAAVSGVSDNIEIDLDVTDILPGKIGKTLGAVWKGLTSSFGVDLVPTFHLKGYSGIIIVFALKAFVGLDLIASLVFLIIIGETFALMISYVKRAFMCIFLGIMAPLIVAVDVVQKSLK